MPNEKFYTGIKWRNLRDYKLTLNPFCERCKEIATEVHHKIEIKINPDLALDINNLESLCKPCHSKHTYTAIKRDWKIYKLKHA